MSFKRRVAIANLANQQEANRLAAQSVGLERDRIAVEERRCSAEEGILNGIASMIGTRDRVDISKNEYLNLLEMKKDYDRMLAQQQKMAAVFIRLGLTPEEMDEILSHRPKIRFFEDFSGMKTEICAIYRSEDFKTNDKLRKFSHKMIGKEDFI